MAHLRQRQCGDIFEKTMAYSPIAGIFGHRQVGKTTFSESVAKTYLTLDQRAVREAIRKDPDGFLARLRAKPAVIDECQLEPDLFPALKEHVRKHKAPGQFVLTGSVRFTSRRAIRESLTGRLLSVELFPLVLSELERRPLPDILPMLLRTPRLNESTLAELPPGPAVRAAAKALARYLKHGGLPRICFAREPRHRDAILADLHGLILDRDLRLVVQTRLSIETLREFLALIAESAWNPWNSAEAKRRIGIAHATQRGLLYALESIFLIRRIPLRQRTGEILLMEDQFEEFALSRGRLDRSWQLLSAFYRNARAQFGYRMGEAVVFSSYWTPDGARVPLVIEGREGKLGIHVIAGDLPSLSQRRSSDSFLRHNPDAKVVYVSESPITPAIHDQRSLIAPIGALL